MSEYNTMDEQRNGPRMLGFALIAALYVSVGLGVWAFWWVGVV
jgi:hypothetical protein